MNNTRGFGRANPNWPHRRFYVVPIVAAVIALSAMLGLADQLCYNHVTDPGAPPNFGAPPLIDGSIKNGDPRWSGPDFGWTNSFGYIFNNPDGPVIPDVTVEGIHDDKYLYLSVQVNNSTPTTGPTSDPNNAIVVAFDPDNSGNKMQWLVIYPVQVGASTGNKQNTQSVEFYWNQSSLSSPVTDSLHYALNPMWLYGTNGAASSSGWTTNCGTAGSATCIQSDIEGAAWNMEIALPLNGPLGDPSKGLILPTTGLFRMYFNVFRIVGTQPGVTWAQAPFPSSTTMPGCTSSGSCFINTSIPADGSGKPSGWGNGTIDPNPSPACTGVSIGSQNLDISITNSTFPGGSNWIDAKNPNQFHANVHNTGAAASNVGVDFYIADWGLPTASTWQKVTSAAPTTITGPTTPVSSPPPGWTPSPSEQANYIANPHQCILATLTSNPPPGPVFFTNANAVQNANVFDASTVERPVRVATKGYPKNPEHDTEQVFDIAVTTAQTVLDDCKNRAAAATNTAVGTTQNCTVSRLVETAEACRHTGMYLTSKANKKIELCQPVGSFTFIATHRGPVQSWTQKLTGPGLSKPDKNGIYHLRVPNDTTVDLNNVVSTGVSGGGCTKLFGFSLLPLFGGMIVIGLVVYRQQKNPNGLSAGHEKESD